MKTLVHLPQKKSNCAVPEMCISLSITQVTITACAQGTYSFPVSAIISEQAVDLILHEEGKTNIQ